MAHGPYPDKAADRVKVLRHASLLGRVDACNHRRVRPANTLAIFDVDGTLTRTAAVDADAFVQAIALELSIDGIDTDWSRYAHTTDAGIAREIVARHRGRVATDAELARVETRFALLLGEAASRDPAAFAEIPGAGALLAALRAADDWAVAIASGAWRSCALVKLRAARIDVAGLPVAFAEDGPARETIIDVALARASGAYDRVVCVGDAVWDVRAARRLGLPFLGVGTNGAAMALRTEGATEVVPDLRDQGAFLAALGRARVPLR